MADILYDAEQMCKNSNQKAATIITVWSNNTVARVRTSLYFGLYEIYVIYLQCLAFLIETHQ